MNAALESVAGQRFPAAAPGRTVRRLQLRGFHSVRRTDIELTNRFASIDEYIAYRRGFGKPSVWTAALYERFLQALHREARMANQRGSIRCGFEVVRHD